MEVIAAVSSVIQVAQFGISLSLGLYKLADSTVSANKETKYIAKDIGLFCTVLKALGIALEQGHDKRLFRDDAYDVSDKIVRECREVFQDIDDALKKATGSRDPLADGFSLPIGAKLRWIFKKDKLDFYRNVLESLKSTILIQLAVLNYADRASSKTSDVSRHIQPADVLELESLILADFTTKESLKDTDRPVGVTTAGRGSIAADGIFPHRLALKADPGSVVADVGPRQDPRILSKSQIDHPGEDEATRQEDWTKLPLVPQSENQRYWSRSDALGLALQQLRLTKWEYERLEENIASQSGQQETLVSNDHRKENLLLERLRREMHTFGVRGELIDLATNCFPVESLVERVPFVRVVKTPKQIRDFPNGFLHPRPSDTHTVNLSALSWSSGIFADILYEHTQDLLESAGVPRKRVNDGLLPYLCFPDKIVVEPTQLGPAASSYRSHRYYAPDLSNPCTLPPMAAIRPERGRCFTGQGLSAARSESVAAIDAQIIDYQHCNDNSGRWASPPDRNAARRSDIVRGRVPAVNRRPSRLPSFDVTIEDRGRTPSCWRPYNGLSPRRSPPRPHEEVDESSVAWQAAQYSVLQFSQTETGQAPRVRELNTMGPPTPMFAGPLPTDPNNSHDSATNVVTPTIEDGSVGKSWSESKNKNNNRNRNQSKNKNIRDTAEPEKRRQSPLANESASHSKRFRASSSPDKMLPLAVQTSSRKSCRTSSPSPLSLPPLQQLSQPPPQQLSQPSPLLQPPLKEMVTSLLQRWTTLDIQTP